MPVTSISETPHHTSWNVDGRHLDKSTSAFYIQAAECLDSSQSQDWWADTCGTIVNWDWKPVMHNRRIRHHERLIASHGLGSEWVSSLEQCSVYFSFREMACFLHVLLRFLKVCVGFCQTYWGNDLSRPAYVVQDGCLLGCCVV